MKKARQLTHKEIIQIADCIRMHRDKIAEEKTSWPELVKFVTAKTGIPVTVNNLIGVCQDCEITWERKKTTNGESAKQWMKKTSEDIQQLSDTIHSSHNQHAVNLARIKYKQDHLIKAIYFLFDRLGEPLPRGFPTTDDTPLNGVAEHPSK